MSTEINSAATRYERLRRMADDPSASDTERDVARAKMAALVDKHGEARLAWDEAEVTVTSDFHAQLLAHAASHHGCGHTLRNGTPTATLRGPRDAVAKVVAEVARHEGLLHAFLMNAAIAYIRGADIYTDPKVAGATEMSAKRGDPQVHEALVRGLQGFHRLGQLHRTPDYTLPQLPARTGGPQRRHFALDELYGARFFFATRTA